MTDARTDTQETLHHWREAVPNDRLNHLIRDSTRAGARALQMRLAAYSVPLGHWTFLRILWERDGLTQRELSMRAGVMEPTTFTALKVMEKLGYVRRRKLPGNKRKSFVFLTPAGRALKRKLVPLAIKVNEIAARGIPARDLVVTRRVLLAMIENLARDEAEAQARRRSGGPTRTVRAAAALRSRSRRRTPA